MNSLYADSSNPMIQIVSGRSNQPLAENIAKALDTQLAKVTIRNFSDGELWVKFEENIRGVDLFIVQSTPPPSDNLMELLMLIDAAKRASAKRVTAVIPYYGYARQDRKDQPRVSITAKLVANLLTEAGADRIITVDLHAAQLQGFFDIPLDHLYASSVILRVLKDLNLENLALASPDLGSVKAARSYAKRLEADLLVVDKRRPAPNIAEVMNIIGDPSGKNVIIVDDLIDTAGTLVNCAKAMKERGAQRVFAACTHAVFSGTAIEKIEESPLEKVYVTDSILRENLSPKIEVLSLAKLFAEAIIRTHNSRSISSLFDI